MSQYDEQVERIKLVFGTDETPVVKIKTIRLYFKYLKKHLVCPCLLTGIESMGYFKWEERFSFGYGSEAEHTQLRRECGSFREKYEFSTFDAWVEDWDILANVYRIPYRKKFTIPLSELQAVDKGSHNYQLLNDYTVWFVNWR
ncbi:MAG: hypothetical protein JW850_08070 [Thermoflexales bacterium]|nr:hypothetical protein [Thermoflexales bacterium]